MVAADVIRAARTDAGLSQAEVARRLGTTQTAVAKLERRGANPTVETLHRVMHATGHRLELRAVPEKSSIDDSLVASALRWTPEQRLHAFESWRRSVVEMVAAAARGDAGTS